jgi:hypothetical protein
VSAAEVVAENQAVVVPGILVDHVVHTPFGSHPGGMYGEYDEDLDHMAQYYEASRDVETLSRYMQENVFDRKDHADYLSTVGSQRLLSLRVDPALKVARRSNAS